MTTAEKKVRILVHFQGAKILFGENGWIYIRLPDNDTWTKIGRNVWVGGSKLTAHSWEEALQGLIDGRKEPTVYCDTGISLAGC